MLYVLALSNYTENTCRFLTKLRPFTTLILKRYGRKISTFLEKELALLLDRSLSRDNGTLAEPLASKQYTQTCLDYFKFASNG